MSMPKHAAEIDAAIRSWRQGDITLDGGLEFLHLANLSRPLSLSAQHTAAASDAQPPPDEVLPLMEEVSGLVILSQTCDIIRNCIERPFVEVAPLILVDEDYLEAIKRLKRPNFAYVPATADRRLVADLDRSMTIEKSIVAKWTRIPGWTSDEEIRDFAEAISRKHSRFAFPDDFEMAASRLQKRWVEKHDKQSPEGAHLRALREIRVRGAPSWDASEVDISFWFIKESDPVGFPAAWAAWAETWMKLFDYNERLRVEPPTVCRLEDMTARDYVESDRLDLNRLSRAA